MSQTKFGATRRLFLAGAAVSAPLAVATAAAAPSRSTRTDGSLEERLAVLEDVEAIRELHRRYQRYLREGAREQVAALYLHLQPSDAKSFDRRIRTLAPDLLAAPDIVEIAPDHSTATARWHCVAEIATEIGPSCTFVEMARAQGGGTVVSSERGALEARYVKLDSVWKIERLAFRQS